MPPAQGRAVVTCMDARLHPEQFRAAGDAHMIRNAGGRSRGYPLAGHSRSAFGTEEIVVAATTEAAC